MHLPHAVHSSDLPGYQLPFNNTHLSGGRHHRQGTEWRKKDFSEGRVLFASFWTNMSPSQLKPVKRICIKIEITETFLTTVCDFTAEVTESFACTFPYTELTPQPSFPLSVPYCTTPASSILPVFLYIGSPTTFITTVFEYHSPVH